MYYDSTILLLIPAIIFAMIASAGVKSTFSKYSYIRNSRNMTDAEAAQRMLRANGLTNVGINHIPGNLTDNFDPRSNTLNLSDSVYDKTSISAVAVACHEAGHALQYAFGYKPITARNSIVPVVNFASHSSWFLIIIGLFLTAQGSGDMGYIGDTIFNIGVFAFVIVLAFHLITLPVEFNASSRALANIQELGLVDENEYQGAKKVLKAAAMTYVAATAVAAANLIRVLAIRGRRN